MSESQSGTPATRRKAATGGKAVSGGKAAAGSKASAGSGALTGTKPATGSKVPTGTRAAPRSKAATGIKPAPSSRAATGSDPAPGGPAPAGGDAPPAVAPQERSRARSHRLTIGIACAVVLAIGGGVAWWRTRGGDSPQATSTTVQATCPTLGPDHPIGTVNGTPLVSSVFDGRVCVALTTNLQSGAPGPGQAGYDTSLAQMKTKVLQSYVFDTVIGQEARLHNVAATQQQIDAETAAQVEASGGAGQLDQQLHDAGGSQVTLADSIRSRLNEANLVDDLARLRAGDVVTRLQGGMPFDQAAREFSDDSATRANGGSVGKVTLDLLKGSDPAFQAAVLTMKPGELTTTPIHDNAGYEVVYMDAADQSSRTFHVIRVASPKPYSTQERPQWFGEFIFLDIQGDCTQSRLTVTEGGLTSPCAAALASPGPSAGQGTATPSPSPAGH